MISKTLVTLAALQLSGCKTASGPVANNLSAEISTQDWQSFRPTRPAKLEMCAAIRGNGNYIFAHWGQLAQALEHYGPIDAVAGGSSGSATSFLYESVYLNPVVWKCRQATESCNEKQRANRMAFLLKSLREFISVLGDRGDFGAAATAVPRLAQRFKDGEYTRAVLSGDFSSAAYHAIRILNSEEFSGIVDLRLAPRLKAAISNPAQLKFEINELQGAIASLDWKAEDPGILLRRGIIDFEALAQRAGIAAEFYAGRDPQTHNEMMKLLDVCADSSVGNQWSKAQALPGPRELIQQPASWVTPWIPGELQPKQYTCGEYYRMTLNKFFDRFNKAGTEPTRLSDPIGGTIPALISTAIYDSVEPDNALRSAYLLFLNGREKVKPLVQSDWIKFGYWGTAGDLSSVKRNDRKYTDIKSARFLELGPAQWAEALRVSPQEPGLGSILCNYEIGSATKRGKWDSFSNLPQGTVCKRWSLGGWSDLYPVQVLKNLGCERVIYATRQDDEGEFVRGVAKLLSANDQDWEDFDDNFFDLDNPQSSAAQALSANDAALCSDWNMIQSSQVDCLGDNAFASPIQSKDEFFLRLNGVGQRGIRLKAAGFRPYPKVQSAPPIRGCLLGAPLTDDVRQSPCHL